LTYVLLHLYDTHTFAFPPVVRTTHETIILFGNTLFSLQQGDLWTLCGILDKMRSCS